MFSLVTQSFGRDTEYRRAVFCILSLYANCGGCRDVDIILFTDNPDFFKLYLGGVKVKYVKLSAAKIKEMRGEIDFLHRMKIALIEEAFGISNKKILYVDSDTFFISDPQKLMEEVAPDICCMHKWEYEFDHLQTWSPENAMGKSLVGFLDIIRSKIFYLANGNPVKFCEKDSSWNAGAMFFHPSHSRFIPDVLALTDQFYPQSLNHASEQYAFSLILQTNTEIKPCDQIVYHYWYGVKKQIVDDFLKRNLSIKEGYSSSALLSEIKEWTKLLPGLFEKHVWMTRDRAIQAFTLNNFSEGYRWAVKALAQKPFSSGSFLKDTLYHLKRQLTHK